MTTDDTQCPHPLEEDLRGRRIVLSPEERKVRRRAACVRWKARNPEKRKAKPGYARAYYLANREKLLLQCKCYRARLNSLKPKRVKLTDDERRAKWREKANAWRLKNRDAVNAKHRQLRREARALRLLTPRPKRITKTKEQHYAVKLAWRARNRDRLLATQRAWREKNREAINAKERANREKRRAYELHRRQENIEKYRAVARARQKIRRQNVVNNIHARLSQQIRASLNSHKSGVSWVKYVGYDADTLKRHLESKFADGMNWERFLNEEIHIDHIIPKSKFSISGLNDPALKECWALTNLQPMWAKDNYSKGKLSMDDWNARKAERHAA